MNKKIVYIVLLCGILLFLKGHFSEAQIHTHTPAEESQCGSRLLIGKQDAE